MAGAAKSYDVLVIGAGHNGLTTAAILARRGRRVLVVEARAAVGGLAAGAEFHPGYRHDGLLHDTAGVRPWVAKELDLASHGLERAESPELLVPSSDGDGLVLSPRGGDSLTAEDASSLARFRQFVARVAPAVRRFLDRPPPDLVAPGAGDLWRLAGGALALRRLGKRDMTELLRIPSMPVADWLDEWFSSDLLKAALAGPAVYSTWSGPRSPGSSTNLLLSEAAASRPIAGGPQALASALEEAARAAGAEIRTDAVVEEILLDGGRAAGVRLAAGEEIAASSVAASCDPKRLFLELLPPPALSGGFEADILNFRSRGTAAKVHLALAGYPEFSCRPGERFERVRSGESLDDLERAFDAVKYGKFSERPVLDLRLPTVSDPSLAPEGHHVASILVSFAPFHLAGDGWSDGSRESLYRAVLAVLESYAPGIEDLIVGSEVLTPVDLAEQYRLSEGHLFHGEHALDQLLIRPVPACARYRTPIEGLVLCGSGSHPGGGLTCVPGALAAGALLR